jgi:CRISPR-associated protein Csm3
MTDHLKVLREKVIIRGTVTALTALHIGWQRSFDPVESDAPVIKDPEGNPYIPGSSFKGVLRSFIEGFLGGAGFTGKLKPCFPTDNDPCIKDKKIEEIKTRVAKEKREGKDISSESEIAKYVIEEACPVCRIFGSSYMGAKLKIKDMPVSSEWNNAFLRIRDGVVIDRDSRTARDKGKYDFEIVSPGVTFSLEIVGDNLEDYEKGLIFTAFDLISEGFGSIGGNVSRGTGRIKIDITGIEVLNTKQFFEEYMKDKNNAGFKKIDDEKLIEYKSEKKDEFIKKFSPEVPHV